MKWIKTREGEREWREITGQTGRRTGRISNREHLHPAFVAWQVAETHPGCRSVQRVQMGEQSASSLLKNREEERRSREGREETAGSRRD